MRSSFSRFPALAFVVAVGPVFVALAACVGSDPEIVAGDGGGTTTAAACSGNASCTAGQTCADGYCCDRPCDGVCESCNQPGHEGTCTPVAGKPQHGACEGDTNGVCAGSCDGTNGSACSYPTVTCGAGANSCAAGVATLAPTCQAGKCGDPKTQACALGCFQDGCLGVTQVAAGYSFACAVLTDKKVRCWGSNSNGQLGQGSDSTTQFSTPKEVQGLTDVVSLAATFSSTCALMSDHTVECWGSNQGGELGLGNTDDIHHGTPTPVPGLTNVTFLSGSSGGHYCAIKDGGALVCWGSNVMGQVGGGTGGGFAPTPTPVCAPGSTKVPCTPATGATFVAGGDDHTCAAFAGGQVACWGGNGSGQLGQSADDAAHPFAKNVDGLTASYLTAGNRISCAASGGAAKCWGGNGSTRLGNGTDDTTQVIPVDVCTTQDCSSHLTGVTAISTYDVSVCALANGAVKCWGDNTGGQLGDGNSTQSQNFAGSTAVASGTVQIVSGGQTNYAIVLDGANRNIKCWGSDFNGECGDDQKTGVAQYTPVSPKW